MEAPLYKPNIFRKQALIESHQHHKKMRALGSLVYLPKQKLFAITRFAELRAALRDDAQLVSGEGISMNWFFNAQPAASLLVSDGADHEKRRAVMGGMLAPRAIAEWRDRMAETAERLVQGLKGREQFCAVADFASHLPVSMVAELVGLSEKGREKMLRWAAAAFQLIGPLNWRAIRSMPTLYGLMRYSRSVDSSQMLPNGWAMQCMKAIEDGRLTELEGRTMIVDFVAPSLDTTIMSASHMFWQLAKNPEAFQAIKEDQSLVPGVVNEALRLSSPIRGFSRIAKEDYKVGDAVLPAKSRVIMLYTSGNRDERHYKDPDHFDIFRNPKDHLGWGHGKHGCVGIHLARLEMEQLLYALCRNAEKLEAWEPVPVVNNILQGFKSLKARIS